MPAAPVTSRRRVALVAVAAVDGDRACLLVQLCRPGDLDDGAAIHVAPRLSASVTRRGPYAAAPATCGWPATARDTSDGIALPCAGDLAPDAIRSVDLRDVRPGHAEPGVAPT